MPVTPGPGTGYSAADLEVLYLRSKSGISTPVSLSDLRKAVYTPDPFTYFSGLSGLSAGSLADHELAYYRAQTGLTSGSLVDCARAFWAGYLGL